MKVLFACFIVIAKIFSQVVGTIGNSGVVPEMYPNSVSKQHPVYLNACSVQSHTWVLMGPDPGPDLNKMLKPGLKAYISMLVLWSMEVQDRNRLKQYYVIFNISDQNFYFSLFFSL